MRLKPTFTDWSAEDRRFLARFVQAARRRIQPTAVVLFGSFARGDYRPDSDIDLLVVVDRPTTLSLHRSLARLLAELAPLRDVTALPTNLRDMDPGFLRNVFREGVLLDGSLLLTAEALALRPRSLLSYSLAHLPPEGRVRVSRRVHGFSFQQGKGRRRKTYRYPGLAQRHRATVLSPSVLLLDCHEARLLEKELRALGARVTVREVFAGA